jgi:hypothetical protein
MANAHLKRWGKYMSCYYALRKNFNWRTNALKCTCWLNQTPGDDEIALVTPRISPCCWALRIPYPRMTDPNMRNMVSPLRSKPGA